MEASHERRSLFLLLHQLLRLRSASLRGFTCYSTLPHARGVSLAGVSFIHATRLACETYAKHEKPRNGAGWQSNRQSNRRNTPGSRGRLSTSFPF